MNPSVPNKTGYWWLGDKPVEVRIQASGPLKNKLAYYVSEVRDFFAVDPNAAWGGESVPLGQYDVIVTVPELKKIMHYKLCTDCIFYDFWHDQTDHVIRECRLGFTEKTTDTWMLPGPNCPRYEGSENTESEEE
jgi:hypothetical protein